MSGKILALIVAALSGTTMAFQGTINALLGRVAGLWEATLVVQASGLAFVALLLFGFRLGNGDLQRLATAPWYAYLGGILGALIIYGVARSIPKVGAANATTAIIVGQVLTAALLDHFGLLGLEKIPFTWWRLIGVALLAGGAWILFRVN